MSKENKDLLLEWDESNIIEGEFESIKDEPEIRGYEGLTEDEIRTKICEDVDLFQANWELLIDSLTDIMKNIMKQYSYEGYWYVEVNNFGWRSLDGHAEIEATDGKTLLRKILPNCDCTFRIFKDGRNRLKLQNFHHDSPTGNEWYYIRHRTKKEIEDDNE